MRVRDLAARCARVLLLTSCPLRNQRAWGMPGAQCARSLAWCVKNTRVSHHGRTGKHPAFPHAMVLTAYFALPGDRLSCHRRLRIWRVKARSGRHASANLTPASRRQDHTTSPSAAKRSRQQRRLRPPHPLPYVRDDRETPLRVGRDGERYRSDLGQTGTEIFLRRGLDWANQLDASRQIRFSARIDNPRLALNAS